MFAICKINNAHALLVNNAHDLHNNVHNLYSAHDL